MCAPHSSDASPIDKEIVDVAAYHRYTILSELFKPTQKNILRVVEVSDKFLKSWEEGITRARAMVEALYDKEEDKTSFNQIYDIEIKLHPQVLYKNYKTNEWHERDDIHRVLLDHLNKNECLLSMNFGVHYNPAEKNKEFSDIHIDRKDNWNIVPPMSECFKDRYICYAIHELFDDIHFSLLDIARINDIEVTVEVKHTKTIGKF